MLEITPLSVVGGLCQVTQGKGVRFKKKEKRDTFVSKTGTGAEGSGEEVSHSPARGRDLCQDPVEGVGRTSAGEGHRVHLGG